MQAKGKVPVHRPPNSLRIFSMSCDRRQFLRSCAVTGVALEAGLFAEDSQATTGPVLSIAHYKTSPAEPDAIAEEARNLTRQAINVLGGMSRFVSR